MDFKEFATNYLNPIFLMYRAFLLIVSFFILFFSIPMFTSSASSTDMAIILIMLLFISAGLYSVFRRRAYILYLFIPFVLVFIAMVIRVEDVVQEGILKIPMAMWWSSAFLLTFNGFRSWGYGISMNDININ